MKITKKIIFCSVLLPVVVGLLFFISSPAFANSEIKDGKTYVFGELNATNTTWTASGSPYIVVGDVVVPEEKTLIIEPGVEIKFDIGYGLVVKGNLEAVGSENNYINFTSNVDSPEAGNWDGITLRGDAYGEIRYAVIEYAGTGINTPHSSYASVVLTNSVLRKTNNGLRYLEDSKILYNDFVDIEGDVFYSLEDKIKIRHNDIFGYHVVFNRWRNDHLSTPNFISMDKNNINIGPSDTWFTRNTGDGSLDLENNYWGTELEEQIIDRMENPELIDFKPYATNPFTLSLKTPLDNATFSSSTSEIQFHWTSINGSGKNLDYYKLYIDREVVATSSGTSTSYNIASLPEGSHQWFVEAVKKGEDNLRSNEIFRFSIDYEEPYTPLASPSGGWYSKDLTVELSAENSDYVTYALDGTIPEFTSSTSTLVYDDSDPINIMATSGTSTVLKAKSWLETDEGKLASSSLMKEIYNFDLTPPGTPVAEPPGGVYEDTVEVALSSGSSTEIRYTTNSSEPTKTSKIYAEPVEINESSVLKARAWDKTDNSSKVLEETYFIESGDGGYYPDYRANLRVSLEEGVYIDTSGSKEVTLSANEETDTIRYTLDGSEVTASSTKYNGPISLSIGTTILKAKAWSQNDAVSRHELKREYVIYDHGTYISENINMDTTWNSSDSPYVIRREAEIDLNAPLTIQPGVKVLLNRDSIIRRGKINAVGSKEKPIVVAHPLSYDYYHDFYDDNFSVREGELKYVNFKNISLRTYRDMSISNSVFNGVRGRFESSTIRDSKFIQMKNVYRRFSEIELGDNTSFLNNHVEVIEETQRRNSIKEDSPAGMFKIDGGNILVRGNHFVKKENDPGIKLFDTRVKARSNEFRDDVEIIKNNFSFTLPRERMLIQNYSGAKIDMRNNYWGTSSEEYIENHIYDVNDDQTLGEVYYEPYAEEPLTFELSYPNKHVLNNSSSITFGWESLVGPESNVDHYQFMLIGSSTDISANVQKTFYTVNEELPEGDYEWYVKAVKPDTTVKSNQHLNFVVDNSVDKVTARPNEGSYIRPQDVRLEYYDKDKATIRYTLDGREPTLDSSIYAGPINVEGSGTTTIKAKAWHNGSSSETMSKDYYIDTDPPEITTSTVTLAKENVAYDNDSPENTLQGVVEEESKDEEEVVGLYLELDKAAVCKYSSEEKDFSSIWGRWYDSEEGTFKSAHGTPRELIAPLGNLSSGNYKYFVICSDGLNQTRMSFEFEKTATTVKERKILDVTSVYPADTHAEAIDSWEDGWQWILNLTAPEDETEFRMSFRDWIEKQNGEEIEEELQEQDGDIKVADNLRFYSAQAAISTNPDQAVIVKESNKYPEDSISLMKDTNEDRPGRQIQAIIEMKVPEETPSGTYYTEYGAKTEKP